MEYDMSCPRCGSPMVSDGKTMLCSNNQCGYQYDHAKKLPTYDEMLKINNILRKAIEDFCECHNSEDELVNQLRKCLELH